jgi:putative transposase
VAGLSAINRGFNKVPKRAEGRVSAQLRDTFVDSGVATALESIDNQILYGRRGTGKTHAFSYLAATRAEEGDIGIYVCPDPGWLAQRESCRPCLWAGRTIPMATRKRHTPQQVVRKLTQADRMLAGGKEIADVCRELQVSEQTYYRWRNQFGGLKPDDVKRLKELERENATLKRLLAEAQLEKAALKEIARGNF